MPMPSPTSLTPMDTDSDADTPLVRRSTRSALMDLHDRIPIHNTTFSPTAISNINVFPTPSPSPDELIIQQRGRRRIPATWSPPETKHTCTPTKLHLSPRSPHVLRSTPRKRLLMGDLNDPPSPDNNSRTPRKVSRMALHLGNLSLQAGSPLKKLKTERLAANQPPSALPNALKGLSHAQLVDMLVQLTQKHPELESEVLDQMPAPDLRPVEEQLSGLKKNIFKSLPTSRLTSKYDSPAYNRASTHVMGFKKYVIETGRQLVESEHWGAVVEYVLLAWSYVRATPVWENTIHNNPRRQCFKALASQCMTALKRGTFNAFECQQITEKLEGFQSDSEDVTSVLKQLMVMRSKNATPTKVV